MQQSPDEARFRLLFDRHHRAIGAYFLRRMPQRADALDATEDVFLVAWRRLADVPDGDGELPWLYGVAHNVLANQRRSVARLLRLRRKIAAQAAYPIGGTETVALRSLDEDLMIAALETLTEPDREVLRLTYWEQLPHETVARVLGCSTEAVHVRRYRAVKRLAYAMARAGHMRDERTPRTRAEGASHVD